MKFVNLLDVKLMFDEKERVGNARLDEALNVVPDRSSQETTGEEVSLVVFKGEEVVRSTVVAKEKEGKGHPIDIRRGQGDANVRAAILQCYKARAARNGEALPVTVDARQMLLMMGRIPPTMFPRVRGLVRIGEV